MISDDITTRLFSESVKQKFGKPNQFGESIFAWSEYGDENIYAGIYRSFKYNGKHYQQRLAFFDNPISHTEIQDQRRSKFASAVSAWQALAPEIKARYNKRAIGRSLFGYHIFISEYMKL